MFKKGLFLGIAAAQAQDAVEDSDKIVIDLHFESECPACRSTITKNFAEAYKAEGFLDMVTINYFPFGNAKEQAQDDSFLFECQHGAQECNYNIIETCALNLIEDPYKSFEFVNCIENNDYFWFYQRTINSCQKEVGIDENLATSIYDCYSGDMGSQLEHVIANATNSLNPPHKYVPWILVDGEHNDDLQQQVQSGLLKYVCDNYKGPNRSADCDKARAMPTTLMEYIKREFIEPLFG